MNRLLMESPGKNAPARETARIEVFKRRELFVSMEERGWSRISTFVDSIGELVEEVSRIHSEMRRNGVFVIIDISTVPSRDDAGLWCGPLDRWEREEFVRRYLEARGSLPSSARSANQ